MNLQARTIGLTALAGLLCSSLVWADPGQAPPGLRVDKGNKTAKWPKALKFRNARYAVLSRVDDAKGDEREAMLHTAYLKRVDDRLGDLEEARRYRTGKRGLVVRFARVARDAGLQGDREERKLSTMSLARKHADFRRRGIIRSEELPEIFAYQRGLLQYGPVNRTTFMLAKKREDRLGAEKRKQRDQRRKGAGKARDDRDDERLDRKDVDGRRLGIRGDSREDAKLEAKEAREDAKADAKADRDEARTEAKEEAKLERTEDAEERAAERDTDREQERAEEKTVLQEEEQEDD